MKTIMIASIGAALVAALTPVRAAVSQQTLDNLNAAYQGESNAVRRYEAFAQKAQAEGHAYAAHLFRAAARSESVHQENHRKAIQALGGSVADFKPEELKVGTTAENLRAAIQGESHERDVMYPDFLKQAMADESTPAIRTLIYAQRAEAEHARLYQEALDNLDNSEDTTFYVCGECGFTTTKLPAERCPSCREPVSDYQKIS